MAAINYRKNIDCLTESELHELREALAEMYALPASNPNSFALQATFHGGPPISYCRHGAPGFFTWHRAEVKAFEDALQAVGCKVMLPFWDWSSGPSTGIPDACRQPTYVNQSGATAPNPLYAGPRFGGGMTNRSATIDTTSFDDLAASVQSAMSEPTFSSFQSLINGPHGSIHVRVSGDMCCVPTASYDPIFFLHHANVDRIWARWQLTHPAPLPAVEADWELPPFNRPFSTAWQRGSDVMSTDTLGYRYRTFCFYLPPIKVWEVVVIGWPPPIRERFATARLIAKSERMQEKATEMRVFVNQPRATARTKTIGNPAFAGAFGFIGHGTEGVAAATHCAECALLGHTREHDSHGHDHADHGHGHQGEAASEAQERFDVEFDLTGALRKISPDDQEVSLKLVAVDADGNEIPADETRIDEIEFAVD
jgi:hypothetical protein